jgi:ketosteroid isomerase-like protein
MNAGELIRKYFAAYRAKDRKVVAGLLSDDFTLSSPLDDNGRSILGNTRQIAKTSAIKASIDLKP